MKNRRIIISVFSDITTDQRVRKTANSLNTGGYQVLVVGRRLSGTTGFEAAYRIHRIPVLFEKGFPAYAEWNIRLFFFLLFSKMSALLANDLDTLPANFLISKIRRKPLVYDTHEIFPEVPELIDRPLVKSFWQRLETYLLPSLKYVYTVSEAVADYYSGKYGIPVAVVRNVPPLKREYQAFELPSHFKEKKILLYQGAVNTGRGLECAVEAMKHLPEWVLVIAGEGPVLHRLKEKTAQEIPDGRVFFAGKLPPEQLASLTRQAHIGLSIERDMGLNYRFALPNKIFDYIHAGVPVLVSGLPEMSHLVSRYRIGSILTAHDPETLADAVRKLHNRSIDPAVFDKAKKELNWEKESRVIIDIFQRIFNTGNP